MKTNILSLLAFSGLLFFTSCMNEDSTKQELTQEPDLEGLTAFMVEDNNIKTRTTAEYDGSGLNFYWTAGDQLWVNTGTASSPILTKNHRNNISSKLTPHPTTPSIAVKRAATAKFYFNGTFTAPSYPVRYTGKNSTVGDKVTIQAQQNQNVPNDASHLGESGDCGTATAIQSGGRYNFTLNHQAAYLTFMPYTSQSVISGAIITQIKVTADKAICGQFDFNDNGIDVDHSRPAATPANQSITLKLNGSYSNDGFPIPSGTIDASKNAAVMAIAPGTYSSFTVEYTLRDNSTNTNGTITKTYNNITLAAGKNKRVTTDLHVPDYSPWIFDFYLWDAVNPYFHNATPPDEITYSGQSLNGYVTEPTPTDGTNRWNNTIFNGHYVITDASNSCTIAPNSNELWYYVTYGNPIYDSKSLWAFKGHLFTGGLWLKKQATIYNDLKSAGYTQLTSQSKMKERYYSSVSDVTGTDHRASNAQTSVTPSQTMLTNTSGYFFLPALGYITSNYIDDIGIGGYYWSSSGNTLVGNANCANSLAFKPNSARVAAGYLRYLGMIVHAHAFE